MLSNWQLDESELRIIMHVAKPNVWTQHDKCNELVERNEMSNVSYECIYMNEYDMWCIQYTNVWTNSICERIVQFTKCGHICMWTCDSITNVILNTNV